MNLSVLIKSIIVTAIVSTMGWASASSTTEKDLNQLLETTQPTRFSIANTTTASLTVEAIFRQQILPSADDIVLCKIAPAGYDYITFEENDKDGFPVVKSRDHQQLKKNSALGVDFWLSHDYAIPASQTVDIIAHGTSALNFIHFQNDDLAFQVSAVGDLIKISAGLPLSDPTEQLHLYSKRSHPTHPEFNFYSAAYADNEDVHEIPATFRDEICRFEGVRPSDLYGMMQRNYEKNEPYLSRAAHSPRSASRSEIPHIIHSVWPILGDREFPEQYGQWFADTIRAVQKTDSSQGWQYYLWVFDEAQMKDASFLGIDPALANHITIKNAHELTGPLLGDLPHQVASAGHYDLASRLLGYDILNQFGGAYRSLDYSLSKSPLAFHQSVDFYAGIDGGANCCYAGDYFFGCQPGHPIILDAITLIQRNFSARGPAYLAKNQPGDLTDTVFRGGSVPLTLAYYSAANKPGAFGQSLRNIIMPRTVFYSIEDSGNESSDEQIGRCFYTFLMFQ
ncbi:MAG: hypothetical protein NTX76_02095 [Alphaproteobacteria bacterium]|nr:hypothetical protein [Alphaproteobacteria bacterium]